LWGSTALQCMQESRRCRCRPLRHRLSAAQQGASLRLSWLPCSLSWAVAWLRGYPCTQERAFLHCGRLPIGGAGDGFGEGECSCASLCVPRAFGLCHTGVFCVPLSRSMRASSVARVVATGWCTCGVFGLLVAFAVAFWMWYDPVYVHALKSARPSVAAGSSFGGVGVCVGAGQGHRVGLCVARCGLLCYTGMHAVPHLRSR